MGLCLFFCTLGTYPASQSKIEFEPSDGDKGRFEVLASENAVK
jgi:hypothetical protein